MMPRSFGGRPNSARNEEAYRECRNICGNVRDYFDEIRDLQASIGPILDSLEGFLAVVDQEAKDMRVRHAYSGIVNIILALRRLLRSGGNPINIIDLFRQSANELQNQVRSFEVLARLSESRKRSINNVMNRIASIRDDIDSRRRLLNDAFRESARNNCMKVLGNEYVGLCTRTF